MSLASPYARLLNIEPAVDEAGQPIAQMTPSETALGHPQALHGGATASLIEQAGRLVVSRALKREMDYGPAIKLAGMTVDYLRAGPPSVCKARGRIVRLGGRVANVAVEAWAEDPAKPFAAARLTFLIVP
jgi:uncharacterized protein (TIGR00369 family)